MITRKVRAEMLGGTVEFTFTEEAGKMTISWLQPHVGWNADTKTLDVWHAPLEPERDEKMERMLKLFGPAERKEV